MLHNHQNTEPDKKRLFISVLLNAVITIAEFAGGIFSNSLALISDAVHNLSDTMAIIISYIAMIIGKKESTQKNTFGYIRIEILAALFNAVVLIVISVYLFYEAYQRFIDPKPIKGVIMFIVATIGLAGNLVSVLLLHKDSAHNLNVKAAYLHLLGDTLSSVGVIVGSILIYFWNITWIDPLLTVIIGVIIIKGTWGIIKETIEILMQASPADLNLDAIKTKLELHPEIKNIHHIHAWRLSDKLTHFQCHADLKRNLSIVEADKIRAELESILQNQFHIDHITIQPEFDICSDKNAIKNDKL
ncbi:MAG: cobalt transporter [Bacteroidetes bacterium GWC2_33_15]|nr:MAG: cobalt transporter [Bacteroidetes bacterium GWA2_33_15]OFX48790.1 MAG: cobalt transporter [Bacteroidetes bacterium GWC2_33_15]OFX66032.1 MAG: cobalt transporter [Bacteroidetes bacterium GWB2_32_14]OFX68206.1 MAG: cobalt transporter [Bacteroidetes bacterium GWD2_33_33]HAN17982.1 cation transporter [Bacteroidales bacterium]